MSEAARLKSQIERCRKLVKVYESIGPVGNFGRMMIERDIEQGEKALASGSEPWMTDAADALAGCE